MCDDVIPKFDRKRKDNNTIKKEPDRNDCINADAEKDFQFVVKKGDKLQDFTSKYNCVFILKDDLKMLGDLRLLSMQHTFVFHDESSMQRMNEFFDSVFNGKNGRKCIVEIDYTDLVESFVSNKTVLKVIKQADADECLKGKTLLFVFVNHSVLSVTEEMSRTVGENAKSLLVVYSAEGKADKTIFVVDECIYPKAER